MLCTRVDIAIADEVRGEARRCGLSVSEWLDAALRYVLSGSPMPKPKGEK